MPDYGVVVEVELSIKAPNEAEALERAKKVAARIQENNHRPNYRWWPDDIFSSVGAVVQK